MRYYPKRPKLITSLFRSVYRNSLTEINKAKTGKVYAKAGGGHSRAAESDGFGGQVMNISICHVVIEIDISQ